MIEIATETAEALEARAAARGISVSEVVAELAARDDMPAFADRDQIAELDRRWAAVEAGQPTVPHDDVAKWLDTWGTATFRPWSGR